VKDSGISPLEIDNPLGHGVAFGWNPDLNVLALQYNRSILTVSKMLDYFKSFDDSSFEIQVILRDDAWARVQAGNVKSISLKIAPPADAALVEQPSRLLKKSLAAGSRA